MTAPFIRRGAKVTPRDLSEAGVGGATVSHHLLPGVIGSLHSLACTREECVCTPVFVVREEAIEQVFEGRRLAPVYELRVKAAER